jgi:hypothetical protein
MTSRFINSRSPSGLTVISPILSDPAGFHSRLLLAGLRFAPIQVRVTLDDLPTGRVLKAVDDTCTGYLLGTDGAEASGSDLYGFLSSELMDGDWITISGHYRPTPRELVESKARFAMLEGRLIMSEKRVLKDANGHQRVLVSRSDLEFENVVPFRPEVCKAEFSG